MADYDGPAPKFRARHLLHRRYMLDMAVRVHFDDSGVDVTHYEEPEFFLLEIRSVSPSGDGEYGMEFGEVQERFGLDEWKTVLEAEGDFSTIGLTLREDAPVSGIEEYWDDQREPAMDLKTQE